MSNKEYFKDIKKPGLFRKINLWWDFEGRYIISDIKMGIKNMIYWLPVIWKDRNYDQSYTYDILKHKLLAQSKHISTKGRFESSDQSVRRINICIKLIDKIQNDFYNLEYTEYIKEDFWFKKCEWRWNFIWFVPDLFSVRGVGFIS